MTVDLGCRGQPIRAVVTAVLIFRGDSQLFRHSVCEVAREHLLKAANLPRLLLRLL